MSRFTAYRLLTGGDDAAFCHKVTAALDAGWQLYGSPTLSALPDGTVRAAQAVTKEVDGPYDPETRLGSL